MICGLLLTALQMKGKHRMESHFNDLEQSRDHHPAIVTADDRYIEVAIVKTIEVYCVCLYTEEYFARLHNVPKEDEEWEEVYTVMGQLILILCIAF